jgi:hypothetical protein
MVSMAFLPTARALAGEVFISRRVLRSSAAGMPARRSASRTSASVLSSLRIRFFSWATMRSTVGFDSRRSERSSNICSRFSRSSSLIFFFLGSVSRAR